MKKVKNIIIGIILFTLIIIIYLLIKKKKKIITVDTANLQPSLSDNEVTALVEKLHSVIDAGFFVPVDYASIYREVNNNSDYDVVRIANEYNTTYNSNLFDDISNELYWIWSNDKREADLLLKRLKELGF